MAENTQTTIDAIAGGETYLGIEFGSTRIKAVLIDRAHRPIASGSHVWENKLENGIWTYALDDVWAGLQDCYAKLSNNVLSQYGVRLTTVGAMGVSAMMHGYLAFGADDRPLAEFRTWRNTITGEAAKKLSALFSFNIPQRWSIAHLYQAMLNGEEHVKDIVFLTTLAGYIHWQLTGKKVIGIGDGSGMFPIDSAAKQFDGEMIAAFGAEADGFGMPWTLPGILPQILSAGEPAGTLSESGAKLVDPSGALQPGIPFCPPEGDAGTGMVATNSVKQRTGNVSAGTSVFAMAVLEKPLTKYYPEIDMVTTPSGDPVAMVHCNNCTSDIDAWIRLFGEAAETLGAKFDEPTLYRTLYQTALKGDAACDGMLSFNYLSGESITGFDEGRPLFLRAPDAPFTLANFMRTHLYSACATLRIGMEILSKEEHVTLDAMTGHGGFFKARGAGQTVMAAALDTPVTVMETAGEGGPWGMAILAAYLVNRDGGQSLDAYLSDSVFQSAESVQVSAAAAEVQGFASFLERYRRCLPVERSAVETL